MVQTMIPQGTEVIVGAVKDAQFGQTVMFGAGGIFVELIKDVVFRFAPIAKSNAVQMIREIKAYPLLGGYRNVPHVDEEAIAEILVRLSALIMDFPEIAEVDSNSKRDGQRNRHPHPSTPDAWNLSTSQKMVTWWRRPQEPSPRSEPMDRWSRS
jgi:acyl-CoA synthetase (NDP forming)